MDALTIISFLIILAIGGCGIVMYGTCAAKELMEMFKSNHGHHRMA